MEDITYYLKTKSIIDVIRINYQKNKVILTIYYTSNKPILTIKIKEKYNIKEKDLIYRQDEDHQLSFHKKNKPFEFHLHIKIDKNKLYDFLKDLFKLRKIENYHLDRLFKNYKRKKFQDGSYLNQEYCIKINKEKKFNFLIKSQLANDEEIYNSIFKKRANWKQYIYGDDMICHLLNFDYIYNNEKIIYIAKSLVRNIIEKSKKVKKLINIKKDYNEKDIKSYYYIYSPNGSYLYKDKKANINIFKYIEENINSKCYPENQYCYMVYQVDIINDMIVDIKYDIDYNNDKELFLDILEGIMYHIIDNIFPPLKKVNKYKNFIKI